MKRSSLISNLVFFLVLAVIFFTDLQKEISAWMISLRMGAPGIEQNASGSISGAELAWAFRDMDGKETSLRELQGKTVFINYWATWCPPCRAEMSSIQNLYDQLGNKVVFVMLSSEQPNIINEFLSDKGYTFPVYQNIYQPPQSLAAPSLPTTFIIDPKGNIVLKESGAAAWDAPEVIDLLERLSRDNA